MFLRKYFFAGMTLMACGGVSACDACSLPPLMLTLKDAGAAVWAWGIVGGMFFVPLLLWLLGFRLKKGRRLSTGRKMLWCIGLTILYWAGIAAPLSFGTMLINFLFLPVFFVRIFLGDSAIPLLLLVQYLYLYAWFTALGKFDVTAPAWIKKLLPKHRQESDQSSDQ